MAHTDNGGRPLGYDDPRHLAAHQFLVEEATLLERAEYRSWLALLTDDVSYLVPVRPTLARGSDHDDASRMDHFDEDRSSLEKRVERFETEHAWAEDPPSRLRHLVTNVRTFARGHDELEVESSILVIRSRGDRRSDFVSGRRTDVLRMLPNGNMALRRRRVELDESVLRTQNLAFFF